MFKQLLNFAGSYKYLIVLSCILSAISAVISLLPFVFIWLVIRDIFLYLPDITKALSTIKYGYMAVASALISVLIYLIALMCSHLVAFRVEKNIRVKAMHKIVTLPLGFFSKNTSGKLRKVIDDNASLTHSFLAHQLPDISGVFIMPIAIFIILFSFDWCLGVLSLAPIFMAFLFLKQMMSGEENVKEYMDSLEDMNSCAVEYIRGIPVVKVFQQSVYSFKDFHRSIKRYKTFVSRNALVCRIPMVGFTISINIPTLILIPFGILLISKATNYNEFLLDLIFYILFVPVCSTIMTKIMFGSQNIIMANQALTRVNEILNAKALNQNNLNLKPNNYEVEFKNVTFTYSNCDTPAIDDVSFFIESGKTYALVGPSGSGKSTIASLIPRFWDVEGGSISIGGVNIKDFDEEYLMSQIAFVFQNSN